MFVTVLKKNCIIISSSIWIVLQFLKAVSQKQLFTLIIHLCGRQVGKYLHCFLDRKTTTQSLNDIPITGKVAREPRRKATILLTSDSKGQQKPGLMTSWLRKDTQGRGSFIVRAPCHTIAENPQNILPWVFTPSGTLRLLAKVLQDILFKGGWGQPTCSRQLPHIPGMCPEPVSWMPTIVISLWKTQKVGL